MVNQFLALSLFVMLLSFFIVLNSMSTFEVTKARPILKSISLAFSEEEFDPVLEANIVQQEVEESYQEGSALDRLGGLFSAQLKGAEVEKNRLGTMMRIRLPVSEFSSNILVSSTGDVSLGRDAPLLPTMISLLQLPDGIPYRMDLVLNLADNPASIQNDAPEALSSNLKSVASYAEAVENAGLPKKMVSAGLGAGPKDTIDLYFRRYVPFNPKGL